MAHARTTVRTAIVSAVTGLTTSGTNVDVWRLHAKSPDSVPGLLVSVAHSPEQVSDTIENELGDIEVRDLPFLIECIAVESTAGTHTVLANLVDTMCAEVETALMADATLGGAALDVALQSTEIEFSGSGERPVAVARMEWLARYSVDSTDPAA